LIDLNKTPIERITENGIKTTGEDFKFDMIIYATGFDAVTGAFDAVDFKGVDGKRLLDKWVDGPKTYLGITVQDFPNMFMV
jgi:cation diffusion facilitator CzcD-associated flavoprotein CzcO